MMMTSLIKIAHWVQRQKKAFLYLFLSCVVLVFSTIPCFAAISIASYDEQAYLETCVTRLAEKYSDTGNCWSCGIIEIIMQNMTSYANTLGGLVTELSKQVLLIGSAIWLAIFFLKSLSSPAQQDLSKVLDGAFTFMFKVALVYFLISGGVGGLVGDVVNPLLSIGVDAGTTFTSSVQ